MPDLPLDTVLDVRARTRRAAQIGWIPLALFAVVVAGSLAVIMAERGVGTSFGRFTVRDPLSLYWMVAIPAGYVLSVVLIEVRARRTGLRSSMIVYFLAGIALLGAYLAVSLAGLFDGLADFTVRGLAPTVTIGLALFVLALRQRSQVLAISAVVVSVAAFVCSLYDADNVILRLGVPHSAANTARVLNVVVLAVVLVLCAVAARLSARHGSRP